MNTEPTASADLSADDMGRFFDGYARDWDAYYRSERPPGHSYEYHTRQRVAIEQIQHALPRGARLLEVGCGAGHTALKLVQLGYDVTCLDVSQEMLAATERTFAEAGKTATTVQGTVQEVPPDVGPFDGILALGVMDYIPDTSGTIAAMSRLLRPGGLCVLTFANARSPYLRMEQPIKNGLSLALYALTRRKRSRDIAFRKGGMHDPAVVRACFAEAGIEPQPFLFLGRGIRLGSYWFPPLRYVARLDRSAPRSASATGRCLIAIGTKR